MVSFKETEAHDIIAGVRDSSKFFPGKLRRMKSFDLTNVTDGIYQTVPSEAT